MANGNRLFRVTATGYNDWINSVYVQPNAVTPITAVLTPSRPEPDTGPGNRGFIIVSTPAVLKSISTTCSRDIPRAIA